MDPKNAAKTDKVKESTTETETPKVETPTTVAEAVEVLEILGADAVQLPDKKTRRGSVSQYPFDKLEINQSVGVKNKTAEKLRPTVNNQNRKYREPLRDEAGNILYVMADVKDEAGNVTGKVPTDKMRYRQLRKFEVRDVDPKKDPQGASARIWRVAV